MMRIITRIVHIIAIILASATGLFGIFSFFSIFPLPRGTKVNRDYYTYYENVNGIYYISVKNSLELLEHGSWSYLEDADKETFTVLNSEWAKDARHVWRWDEMVENADAESFHINKGGVPVDRYHVYVNDYGLDADRHAAIPSESGIDAESAEYFVTRLGHTESEWMRDKNHVYFYDRKVDVDRNSFRFLEDQWFVDRHNLYIRTYDKERACHALKWIDSLQIPIESGYNYLRNGRNIIYHDTVILRDIDVRCFKEIGCNKYRINDTLFYNGTPYLKDSVDVACARFYLHGNLITDGKSVFYMDKRLDDIDAATFRQINDDKYEDRNFIYTMKPRSWQEEYPFEKKRKKK